MQAFYIISIYLLLRLFFEDWRTRSVNWYLFPSILVCSYFINSKVIENYLPNVITNLAIVLIQLITIVLYLKFKKYDWRNLTSNYFALGDILFLLVLSFSFETELFLMFNICSILLSIIIARIWKLKTIPFAGIQSLLLAFVLAFNLFIR
jgi:hypothetical protein